MKRYLTVLFLLAAGAMAAECVVVRGESVVASDLAKTLPAFSALPPTQALLRAPVTGATRWIGSNELENLLSQPGVQDLPRQGICIVRATRRLERDSLLYILKATLGQEDATLEIIDYSRYAVPDGEIQFTRSGLLASAITKPDQPILWKGHALSADGRSTPIWVRLKIYVEREVLVAAHPVPRGRKIEETDVALERRRVFPQRADETLSKERVVGHLARRKINSGEPLLAASLMDSSTISAGQEVTAEVTNGTVRLRLPAMAEMTGRRGDLIWVRPSGGGKRLRGRLTESGIVIVEDKENENQTTSSSSSVPARTSRASLAQD